MEPADTAALLSVTVACSPRAGLVDEVAITVPAGATLADALHLSQMQQRHPQIDLASQPVGIWGALRPLDAVLRDGDRVEIYRPLQVDPMEARRARQRRQAATCSRRK
ncbi:MAG: RnfH family protein [Pseudomonadota bacterium]|nr:RnfH family protein [Pseudomonadota bacterium]